MMQEFPGGQPPDRGNGREFPIAINEPVQGAEDSAYEALGGPDNLEDIPRPEQEVDSAAPSAERIGGKPETIAAEEPDQEREAKPADGVVDEAAVVQRAAEAVQAKRPDRTPQPIAAEVKAAKDDPEVDPDEVANGELTEVRVGGAAAQVATAQAAEITGAELPVAKTSQETALANQRMHHVRPTKPAGSHPAADDSEPLAKNAAPAGNEANLGKWPVERKTQDRAEPVGTTKPVNPLTGSHGAEASGQRPVELEKDTRDRPSIAERAEQAQRAVGHEFDESWMQQSLILQKASEDLLTDSDEEPNSYLRDAYGSIQKARDKCLHGRATMAANTKEGILRRAAVDVAKYAAATGRTTLSQDIFDTADPKDQWAIYSNAYASSSDPDQLAVWRNQLDVDYEHMPADERTPEMVAARLLAMIETSLHGGMYGIDPEAREAVLRYGDQLTEVISGMKENAREVLRRASTVAFARAGLVEGTTELTPKCYGRRDPAQAHNTELATKAAAGQLSTKERVSLRLGGITGRVLRWIDSRQKGESAEMPIIPPQRHPEEWRSVNVYLQDQELLMSIAPQYMTELGIVPASPVTGLEMALAARDFESARRYYVEILDSQSDNSRIRAALLMSQHLQDIDSASAAHAVFEGAFASDLAQVGILIEKYKEVEDGPNNHLLGAIITQELDDMFRRISELQDPVTSLPARAQLLQLYLDIAPDAENAGKLITNIESQWTILEQRQGGDEELIATCRSLRQAGMEFVKQYKQDGYVGYVPLSPLRANRTPIWDCTVNGERKYHVMIEVANMIEAAGQLNWLLQEQRYRVQFEKEEDRRLASEILQGLHPHGSGSRVLMGTPVGRVYLQGPWQQLYPALRIWDYDEFRNATDTTRSDWPLHTEPALTKHLQDLLEEVIK